LIVPGYVKFFAGSKLWIPKSTAEMLGSSIKVRGWKLKQEGWLEIVSMFEYLQWLTFFEGNARLKQLREDELV
jgi:hypothetical protein